MRSRLSPSAALGGAAILALAAAAASTPSCVKKPQPRIISGNVTTPEGDGKRRGDTQEGRVPTDGTGDPTNPGSNATEGPGDGATATPTATVTVGAIPTATATAAATAVAGEPTPAVVEPSITMRAFFSGGYFKNCVFLRPNSGGAWTKMGCTKKESTTAGTCVGLDSNFRSALKVAPAAKGPNRFEIRIDTVHQTRVCEGNTFVYDSGGTKVEANPNPASGEGSKRFKCGRKDLGGGVQRVKVCYEDSTDANFKDLILLFDAKGEALFEIEGLESKCVDDVKPEIENDC